VLTATLGALVTVAGCSSTSTSSPTATATQGAELTETGVLRDDPNRPVAEISGDLGVTPDQFRACFSNVNPAPGGSHPIAGQTTDNKVTLLPCLQEANPDITNTTLDTVMDTYRPGGREAQLPQ
jgi:hypothetical protein